ncbi:AraC family transcriptional regulator [Listeria sp. FSL L7-1582]|uniref:AraC family transcriptional regulator n=1 Tax=Listeria portnoyi TaxID=2713504 RepID=UPI00164EAC12|nr:helix-turn-helix domain-containing protein [Listeria portnoyi]MBC6309866.1 AraC family transcriptional regulator [Listeria portnoyi]
MNFQQLDQYLRAYDAIEKRQVLDHQNINDVQLQTRKDKIVMPDSPFFEQGDIFISKHHRFAPMPEHTHQFIELNYIYSGVSKQVINGEEYQFSAGQFCLFDQNTSHSIAEMGENDILLNVIFRSETIKTTFIKTLESNKSIVSDFLLSAALSSNTKDHFIRFDAEENEQLQHITKMMLTEFFDPKDYSSEMMKQYLALIFMELARVFHQNKAYQARIADNSALFPMLEYIEKNYKTVTLTKMAQEFGFNKNYLSNKLRKETGKTWTELVSKQKLHHATHLLAYTDNKLVDIAEEVGYASPSFFFKQFKRHYGMTPKEFRDER